MIKKILILFICWRISVLIITLAATIVLPVADESRYLGGGFINYVNSPVFFSQANFDGEHYIAIAIFGYKRLEQAFFPVYPLLIRFLSFPFYTSPYTSLVSSISVGAIISNLSFLLSLILLYKLIKLDYPLKIAWSTLVLICLFPTSYFFTGVYTESLFLLLVVGSFLAARKNIWWLAGILGGIASATRVFGIFLLPVLIIEWWFSKKSKIDLLWLFFIPFGLLAYMVYQSNLFGDYLAFYHLQVAVGEQRQLGIILLPQVFWRYLKILTTVDYRTEIYQTVVLELLNCLLFLGLILYGYLKKMRLSYLVFCLIGLLLSPLQGSLSSVPRYVIILFPGFISLSLFLENRPRWVKWTVTLLFSLGLIVETTLFVRGYWVA